MKNMLQHTCLRFSGPTRSGMCYEPIQNRRAYFFDCILHAQSMKVFFYILCLLTLSVDGLGQDTCFDCVAKFEKARKQTLIGSADASQRVLASIVGCKAPEFDVRTILGEALKLSSLKGKVVVLNFWFIECAPCITELPALNRLVDEYKNEDVVFIAFGRDDPKSIAGFLKKKEFKYKIVPSNIKFATDQYCIIAGWPTSMVIDKNGVVRLAFSGGYMDERALTHAYEKIRPVVEKYLR